ncbi:hypothetical protein DFJ73DRAFT_759974 [Zopfochytrium polystomum]|nr:hypothetical protein DFJ73DRAFT_759974 [Zopfochytrium polystomum]
MTASTPHPGTSVAASSSPFPSTHFPNTHKPSRFPTGHSPTLTSPVLTESTLPSCSPRSQRIMVVHVTQSPSFAPSRFLQSRTSSREKSFAAWRGPSKRLGQLCLLAVSSLFLVLSLWIPFALASVAEPGDVSLPGDKNTNTVAYMINVDTNCTTGSGKAYLYVNTTSALIWDAGVLNTGDFNFSFQLTPPSGSPYILLANGTLDIGSKRWPFVVPNITMDSNISYSLTGTYTLSPTQTPISAKATPGTLATITPRANIRFLQPGAECPVEPSASINIVYIVPPIAGVLVITAVGVLASWLYRKKLERRQAKGKSWADGPNKPIEKPPNPWLAWLYPPPLDENNEKPEKVSFFSKLLKSGGKTDLDAAEKGAAAAGTGAVSESQNSGESSTVDRFSGVTAVDRASSATSTPSLTSAASKSSDGSAARDSSTETATTLPLSSSPNMVFDSDDEEDNYKIGPDGRRIRRVRLVYNGTPERNVGGSSSWRPPHPAEQRHKVVFPFNAALSDEIQVSRGEVVIVEKYFEDGWVWVRRENKPGQPSSRPSPTTSKGPKQPAVSAGKKGKSVSTVPENSGAKDSGMVPYHCLHVLHDDVIMLFPGRLM